MEPRSLLLVVVTLASACRPSTAPHAPGYALTPEEIDAARAEAADALAKWKRERDERLLEAVDPGEMAEHTHRVSQADIEAGKATVASVFLQGEAIFDRIFTPAEGLGTGRTDRPPPALSRVENAAAMGGPDAHSCRECHGRGGDDGHGELHQRALLDGDGRHVHSAKPRLPPHVAGLGLVQQLAAEMTSDLHAEVEEARTRRRLGEAGPIEVGLRSKEVEFGTVTLRPDGTLDTAAVRGVDPDLVVKPFGWKGVQPTLRAFLRAALPQHQGMEPLPQPGPAVAALGDWPAIEARSFMFDDDKDGVAGEVREGQLSALAVYLALVDVPVVLPPRDPVLAAAWARGGAVFDRIGCATCHRRELAISSLRWTERAPGRTLERTTGLAIDLVKDNQVGPALDQFDYARPLAVPLLSDLKRHDLGPSLSERAEGGARPSEFLTRPLWGIGDRGRYFLHDGRARSLAEAIRLHHGEAEEASRAYGALSTEEARALDVFLLSLRREPQIRIAP